MEKMFFFFLLKTCKILNKHNKHIDNEKKSQFYGSEMYFILTKMLAITYQNN